MLSPHTQQQHLHRQRSDITQPDEIEQEPAAADVAASDADAGVADTTASSGGAASSRISVFLRVRPVARPSPRVALEAADAAVEFTVPRDAGAGPVNNSRERYRFAFDGVLSPDALQDEVFERAARPLVEAALDGYNATLFAYGQTGSGKTFTMTGGAARFADRGVIPRALSALYAAIGARRGGGVDYAVQISYLEIYNDVGYDLLDPAREARALEELPTVAALEDEDGRVHLRRLSRHRAASEEEALNLLFLGDTNRAIGETPANQASSRSHCVFTIDLEARRAGEARLWRARLNLVDLAGSERFGKPGADGGGGGGGGAVLREARHINLSLHFLEQVIIALQERAAAAAAAGVGGSGSAAGGTGGRQHVPYRNSLMTTMLRDSLGGNCRTVMVATITGAQEHIEESISTCRFAQRVARVTNELRVNEEADPAAVIRQLRQEVRDLKDEVALLRGGGPARGPLTPDERARLRARVEAFCDAAAAATEGSGGEGGAAAVAAAAAALTAGGDVVAIRACFDILRDMYLDARRGGGGGSSSGGSGPAAALPVAAPGDSGSGGGGGTEAALRARVGALERQLAQRDAEIDALRRRAGQQQQLQDEARAARQQQQQGPRPRAAAAAPDGGDEDPGRDQPPGAPQRGGPAAQQPAPKPPPPALLSALLPDAALLADRDRAFEAFRGGYEHNEAIEESKALLKSRYAEAKALATAANASKARVGELRASLERRRLRRAAAAVAAADAGGGAGGSGECAQQAGAAADDEEDALCRRAMERERGAYSAAFDRLRALKAEILQLQALLEGGRARLQRDFQRWLDAAARRLAEEGGGGGGAAGVGGGLAPTAAATAAVAAAPAADASKKSAPPPRPASAVQRPASAARRRPSEAAVAAAVPPPPLPAATATADPEALAAARPHLTGDPRADADILAFYEARAQLLRNLRGGGASAGGSGGAGSLSNPEAVVR